MKSTAQADGEFSLQKPWATLSCTWGFLKQMYRVSHTTSQVAFLWHSDQVNKSLLYKKLPLKAPNSNMLRIEADLQINYKQHQCLK